MSEFNTVDVEKIPKVNRKFQAPKKGTEEFKKAAQQLAISECSKDGCTNEFRDDCPHAYCEEHCKEECMSVRKSPESGSDE